MTDAAMTRLEAGTLLLRAYGHVWRDQRVNLHDRTKACEILWACLVKTIEEGWREEATGQPNKLYQPDLIPPKRCPDCGRPMPYASIPGPEKVCDMCLVKAMDKRLRQIEREMVLIPPPPGSSRSRAC